MKRKNKELSIDEKEAKRNRLYAFLLIFFFLSSLSLRMYFYSQTAQFSDDRAYFNLMQIEKIKQNKIIDFHDNYSYGGRYYFYPPLFQLILGYLSLIFGIAFTAKFIPAFFASLIVFVTYALVFQIKKNKKSALLAGFVSAFIPVYFENTFNSISVFSLFIPLFILLLYSLIRINERKYLYLFVALNVILPFVHPVSFVLIFIYGIYLLILKIESLKITNTESESLIFAILYNLWITFILYKKQILIHKFNIIFQNIPKELIKDYFSSLSFAYFIYAIGGITIIFGMLSLYHFLFVRKVKESYVVISALLVFGILTSMKFLEPTTGFMFLGIIFCIMFGLYYSEFEFFISTSVFDFLKKYIFWIIICLILITMIVPLYFSSTKILENTLNEKEVEAYNFIRLNSKENSTIMTNFNEGFYVSSIARRKNFIDKNFLGIEDINNRYKELNKMYKSPFMTEPLSIAKKYDIRYIVLSNRTKKFFNTSELPYYDKDCFDVIFENDQAKVYEIECKIKKS